MLPLNLHFPFFAIVVFIAIGSHCDSISLSLIIIVIVIIITFIFTVIVIAIIYLPRLSEAAGTFHGHALFGIRGLSVQAPRLQSIVEDCATAAKSSDARDKYFATYVGEFASCSSKQLRSELPSLEVSSPVLRLCSYCYNCAKVHA